jgi:hypothetical protein
MLSRLKNTGKILSILLGLYILLSVGFYLLQERIIFQADSLSSDFAYHFDQPFEEYFIPTPDGDSLNALLFTTDQKPIGFILYCHGNADNLKRWGVYASDFTRLGYTVLMFDYRGYGKSSGSPSEENLYADAATVWNWALSNFKIEKMILFGRSLGAAAASNLATHVQPDLLILETPFDEIKNAVFPPFIPNVYVLPFKFRFSNSTFLPDVHCKKVIIHGTNDWVVPLSSANRLKPFLKADDRFVVIEGGSHNNLREFDLYHTTLKEVLQ